jgi:hypothetical protein
MTDFRQDKPPSSRVPRQRDDAPASLRRAWSGAKGRGIADLTADEIDKEIVASRQGRHLAPDGEVTA